MFSHVKQEVIALFLETHEAKLKAQILLQRANIDELTVNVSLSNLFSHHVYDVLRQTPQSHIGLLKALATFIYKNVYI